MSVHIRLAAFVALGLIASACAGESAPAAAAEKKLAPDIVPAVVREAIATAEAYVEARNEWDDRTATNLLHPDAIIIDTPVVTPADQEELLRFFEAVDWRWSVTECEEKRLDGSVAPDGESVSSSGAVEIVCQYLSENAWSRAVDTGPIEGQFRFAIEDGLITEMYHDYDVLTWASEVTDVFRAWVDNNAPASRTLIWEDEDFLRPEDADRGLAERVVPVLTPEAAEAFAELTAAFVAAAS